MNFSQKDIAKLVLGYLKDQDCQTAFSEFLNSSAYLKKHASCFRRGRHFITRVNGLSLVDFLSEYAVVYTIVQERLEASDYYNERGRLRASLVQQLLYLLGGDCPESRTSTPIRENGSVSSYADIANYRRDFAEKVCDNDSHPHINEVLNATLENSLPGNSSLDLSIINTSKTKNLLQKIDKSTITDDEVDKGKSQEKCEEIFTQTFLENVELIEKLADNINKEVSAKSSSLEESDFNIGQELDTNTIDTIIHRIAKEPIIVNLIEDIISDTEKDKSCENSLTKYGSQDNTPIETNENEDDLLSTPKKTPGSYLHSIKKRLRSSKKQEDLSSSIDEQNADAILSIVAASQSGEKQPVEAEMEMGKQNMSVGEILSSESLNNCTNAGTLAGPSSQNHFSVNPANMGNLLMLQQSRTTPPNTNTVTTNSVKPCYVIGGQQFINIPQSPFKINTLTEQDIMAMPTIIICDNQQIIGPQTIMPTYTTTTIPTQSKLPAIAPKKVDKIQSIGEYITFYQCNESISPIISRPQVDPSPPYFKPIPKTAPPKKKTAKPPKQEPSVISTISTESQPGTSKEQQDFTVAIASHKEDAGSSGSMPQIVTPTSTIKVIKETRSRSTPRNGNHVRQLSFTTPEKWCTTRRAITSPKLEREQKSKGTLVKVPKASAAKNIRTSLFKSPETDISAESDKIEDSKMDVPTKKDGKNNSASWDADLRALTSSDFMENTAPSKYKRKYSDQSDTDLISSKKRRENLNKMEDHIIKIEISPTNLDISSKITENESTKQIKRKDRISTKKPNGKTTKNEKVKDFVETNDKGNSSTIVNDEMKEDTPEKQYEIINRDRKSRIKKKCNIDNSVKKNSVTEELILTNITKIKSCEVINESQNKLILSPSKLNANKRTLVEIDSRNFNVESQEKLNNQDGTTTECTISKSITPEHLKTSSNIPVSTKRNITPVLETPVKFESIAFPKTPGIISPPVINTPFTKSVIEQLEGVDINTFPTPKFPITPNFPFTPALEQSPFSNRGTDYSTSSSYYQPSDTEQNKSLEQLIEECNRLEKQPVPSVVKSKETNCINPRIITTNLETNIETLDTLKKSPEKSETATTIKSCSQSMIAKKNLHLLKIFENEKDDHGTNDSSSSNSSDSSTTCSTSSDDSSNDSSYSSDAKETPTKTVTYSLRSRNKVDTSVKKVEVNKKVIDKKKDKPASKFQDALFKEMEEKRQRTIAKFKDGNTSASKNKTPVAKNKTPVTKSTKQAQKVARTPANGTCSNNLRQIRNLSTKKSNAISKAIIKHNTTPDDKKQVSNQDKKQHQKSSVTKKQLPLSKSILKVKKAKTSVDEDEIIFHLSSDDDNVMQPLEMVETEMLEHSNSCTPTFTNDNKMNNDFNINVVNENNRVLDQEAETLVKGLKQWGIHLIHNKNIKSHSPLDQNQDAETLQKLEDTAKSDDTVKVNPKTSDSPKTPFPDIEETPTCLPENTDNSEGLKCLTDEKAESTSFKRKSRDDLKIDEQNILNVDKKIVQEDYLSMPGQSYEKPTMLDNSKLLEEEINATHSVETIKSISDPKIQKTSEQAEQHNERSIEKGKSDLSKIKNENQQSLEKIEISQIDTQTSIKNDNKQDLEESEKIKSNKQTRTREKLKIVIEKSSLDINNKSESLNDNLCNQTTETKEGSLDISKDTSLVLDVVNKQAVEDVEKVYSKQSECQKEFDKMGQKESEAFLKKMLQIQESLGPEKEKKVTMIPKQSRNKQNTEKTSENCILNVEKEEKLEDRNTQNIEIPIKKLTLIPKQTPDCNSATLSSLNDETVQTLKKTYSSETVKDITEQVKNSPKQPENTMPVSTSEQLLQREIAAILKESIEARDEKERNKASKKTKSSKNVEKSFSKIHTAHSKITDKNKRSEDCRKQTSNRGKLEVPKIKEKACTSNELSRHTIGQTKTVDEQTSSIPQIQNSSSGSSKSRSENKKMLEKPKKTTKEQEQEINKERECLQTSQLIQQPPTAKTNLSLPHEELEDGELLSDTESNPPTKTTIKNKSIRSGREIRHSSDFTKERKCKERHSFRKRTNSEKYPDANKSKPLEKSKSKKYTTIIKHTAVTELDHEEVQFNIKSFHDVTDTFRHDYSKKTSRTLTDYNLDILNKKFSANVYIAEIDSEVEKFLSFTPFQLLLDIPSTSPKIKKSNKLSSPVSKKAKKPLNILYNCLVKSADASPSRNSPLEDLYSPEPSLRDKQQITSRRQSQHKKAFLEEAKEVKKNVCEEERTEGCAKELLKEDPISILELDVLDGVIMLNSNLEGKGSSSFEVNDELMNYALIGSDRVADIESPLGMDDSRKRKSSDDESKQQEKKQKTDSALNRELLKHIDVDSFLKQLHGET